MSAGSIFLIIRQVVLICFICSAVMPLLFRAKLGDNKLATSYFLLRRINNKLKCSKAEVTICPSIF